MHDLVKRIFAIWPRADDGEARQVPIDGKVVLMTRSQERRYRKLNKGIPANDANGTHTATDRSNADTAEHSKSD